MQMNQLSVQKFAFSVENTLKEILNTPNASSADYFVELNSDYHVHLHDNHRDFHLAPIK